MKHHAALWSNESGVLSSTGETLTRNVMSACGAALAAQRATNHRGDAADHTVCLAAVCLAAHGLVQKHRLAELDVKGAELVLLQLCHTSYCCRPGNLKTSVQAAGIPWEGHAHSGLVDARHTALLAARLMQLGAVLRVTGSFAGLDQAGRRQTTLLPPGAR